MYKFILLFGVCSAFASDNKPPDKHPAKQTATDNKCQEIIGCYYTNNESMKVNPILKIEQIDVSLCSHLFYREGILGKDGSVIVTDNTNVGDNGVFQRINDLRKKNRRLKTLLAMTESFREASDVDKNKVLVDPTLREKLVTNIVNFVQKYKFDGIQLESQYTSSSNEVASDKQNFVLLMKALKEKFDKNGLILSFVIDGTKSDAIQYDMQEISKHVSFINLRTYEFHKDIKKIVKAAHIAPLYHSPKESKEDQQFNVDYVIKFWILQHVPTEKLILGTTFKGIDYHLADPKRFGRGAPVIEDPKLGLEMFSYFVTCSSSYVKNRAWTTFWDNEQQVPYTYKGKEMIAYENVKSIKMKAEYAKSMRLGGVFVDSLEDDDFSGHCGDGKFPLLTAVNQVLRDKC